MKTTTRRNLHFVCSDGQLWFLLPFGPRITIPQILVWASKDIWKSELDVFLRRKLAYFFHHVTSSHLHQQLRERMAWRTGNLLFHPQESSVAKIYSHYMILCRHNPLSSHTFSKHVIVSSSNADSLNSHIFRPFVMFRH